MREVDAFIVGSDQVWRQGYGDVPSYMLDFLPASDNRPRVAYAASFGLIAIDEWSAVARSSAANLLRQFSAASVRETQAADFAREHLGLNVPVQVDPTLLLRREDYDTLLETETLGASDEPYVLTYLLDATPESIAAAHRFASRRGYRIVDVSSGDPSRRAQRPSVPEWLALFRYASHVITDSFHGMVFSTIFERPFVVLPNAARGTDRFTSLASILGLQSRLASSPLDFDRVLDTPVSWGPTRDAIQASRVRGRAFLSASLRRAPREQEEATSCHG